MQNTYERLRRTLYDRHDLTFPTLTLGLLAGHSHSDNVTVQSSPGLGRLHEHIIIFPFHYHKGIAFSGHLHLALYQREDFLFLFTPSLSTGISVSCHKTSFLTTQN